VGRVRGAEASADTKKDSCKRKEEVTLHGRGGYELDSGLSRNPVSRKLGRKELAGKQVSHRSMK